MNIYFTILLTSFLSANLILIQQNYILKNMDTDEYFCIKNIIFFFCIVFYMVFINKKVFNNLQKIEFKNHKYILIFDALFTIANIIIWYYLLQNTEAHKLVSTINPLTITLIVILSYVFYDKKITINEMIGILLVLIGIIFINKK